MRHVGAGAHRDADLGLSQCRRIVNAVAGHGNDVAVALQLFDEIAFFARRYLGSHVVDPQLVGHSVGRGATVAREHHDLDAICVEQLNRFRRARFNRIGHAKNTGRFALDRQEHRRLAVATQRFRAIEQCLW